MTGLILAGVDPLDAVRAQLALMYVILAGVVIAAVITGLGTLAVSPPPTRRSATCRAATGVDRAVVRHRVCAGTLPTTPVGTRASTALPEREELRTMPDDAEECWRLHPSKASVVKAVTRRMVPYLIEATLIPTALFYVCLVTLDLRWAIVAALFWTYAAVGRRIVTRRRVPGLLVLATLGISVRTVVFLLNGNDFVYFVQPILRTVAPACSSWYPS